MIEVELPDGSIAEFPDGTPPDVMKQALQKRFPKTPGYAEDAARGFATGVRQGVESGAGMFGDAANMSGDLAGWAAGKLGFGETGKNVASKVAKYTNPFGFLPSTDDIQGVSKEIVGEHYQPKTVAGEYGRTVGQFVPGAVMGPGSVGRKAAMAIVPGVLSETAGQAARMTGYENLEPYARVAGAVAGGAIAAGSPRAQNLKQAGKGAPTREMLKQQTDDLYEQLRQAGITYDPGAYSSAVTKAASQLKAAGIRRSMASDAYGLLDELADDIAKGVTPDFSEINALAQQAGASADDAFAAMAKGDRTAGTNGKAWSIIRDMLDDFEKTAPMTNTAGMSTAQVTQLRETARATALKNIKARRLENAIRNADAYAGGGEAGMRQSLRNLMKSNAGRIYSGAERSAILEVANGRKALLTLSRFGFDLSKMMGNASFLPTVGAGIAYQAGGALPAAGLMAAGTAAKYASPALTNRAFEKASAAVRGGTLNTPQGAQNLKALQRANIIRQLLNAGSGVNSARQTQLAPIR